MFKDSHHFWNYCNITVIFNRDSDGFNCSSAGIIEHSPSNCGFDHCSTRDIIVFIALYRKPCFFAKRSRTAEDLGKEHVLKSSTSIEEK
jgi:hypothetical protein